MAYMESIPVRAGDGELAIVRLLRHYCGTRNMGVEDPLASLVELGEALRLPPAGSVAMASVFQLAEAVLGRELIAERCCSHRFSADERAMLRLLGSPMPSNSASADAAMPHGLPGALTWAVLSVRRLCGVIVPSQQISDTDTCPFTAPSPN